MHQFRIGQAAKLLGVSADTVRRLADAGELKTTRTTGGHRVVDGSDLAATQPTRVVITSLKM